ncbi:MAG TPA: hypothetical protein VLW25_10100 [Bryobacteraceae bacterium]|nr:hypothetical protein [Bryobacteraceae bacterium]
MNAISAADLVWIAAASLTREFPERPGFSPDEIRRRVHDLEPDAGFPDATIRTHIGRHCVANKKPDPGKHRKLYANPDGSYRLYWSRDPFDPERKSGKSLPDPNRIPAKYHELLAWYRGLDADLPGESQETDPILALRGLGKELWRDLGGGEKFIRELRQDWYGLEKPAGHLSKARPGKRRRAV